MAMPISQQNAASLGEATLDFSGGDALLRISGDWILGGSHTLSKEIIEQLPDGVKRLSFEVSALGSYDSTLISMLLRIIKQVQSGGADIDFRSLPDSVVSMLGLAVAVPEADAKKTSKRIDSVNRVGVRTINIISNTTDYRSFFGDVTIAFCKLVCGRARMRGSDLMMIIQRSGPEALPIVALISFLAGLILAFVGSIQLAKYGSEIFVADLVGIAMVREMGAMMVGVVMSGRTGAAFAAELGSMKVNEEISAFKTFGISPIEFLVLPRIIALVLIFPLLTIFADVIGALGGLVIGVGMFDVSYEQYSSRTVAALNLVQISTGVGKSIIFGLIVACIGCRMGMACQNSSSGVGRATTSSVVQSITWIIVADAIFAVIFTIFDI